MKRATKKILSLFLTACMVFTLTAPVTVFAEGGECSNHPVHDSGCGYIEPVLGQSCAHEHDDDCEYAEASEGSDCTFVHSHDEVCGYDGENAESCTVVHVHDDYCGYIAPTEGSFCQHEHDDTCGFVEAVEGQPCGHSCETCGSAMIMSMALDINFPSGGGEGTIENPFQISNENELSKLAELVNAKNEDYNAAYYLLIDDIDLSDFDSDDDPANGNWTPIGGWNTYFYGHFDGGDHTISNLRITSNSSDGYKGLFGGARDATIQNIHLDGIYIEEPKGSKIGGIVGGASGTSISGCSVTGVIVAWYDDGGIVGSHAGRGITSCWTDVEMSGGDSTGGIVGDMSSGTISTCYSKGNIVSAGVTGGIVGDGSFSSINNCYSNCSIKGGSTQAGGIIGNLYYGNIENCYATGGISGRASPATSSGDGGIVGNIEGWTDTSFIVKNCVALNPFVNGGAGRVGGRIYLVSRENLFAWEKMTINSNWVTSGTSGNNQGQSLTTEEILAGTAWPDAFKSGVWEYADGFLPVLAGLPGQDGAIPQYFLDDMSTEGNEDNPFVISTKEQLAQLAADVAEGKTFEDKYFVLAADLDLSAYSNWVPIGSGAMQFRGNFDGQNHTISNLTVPASANLSHAGLFGRCYGNTIQNLHLNNVNVTSTAKTGGLVGEATNTHFYNCSVSGTVTGRIRAGGLLGDSTSGSLKDCNSSAAVNSSSGAGGLAGTFSGLVDHCFATGKVRLDNTSYNESTIQAFAGGLIGWHYNGDITHCYSTGDVTGNMKASWGYYYSGGLVGSKTGGTIETCYASGNINATVLNPGQSSAESCHGGLIGLAAGRSRNINLRNSLALSETITANTGEASRLIGKASDETYAVAIDEAYAYEGMKVNGAVVENGTGVQTVQGGNLTISRLHEAGASSLWESMEFSDEDWQTYAGRPPKVKSLATGSIFPNQPSQWPAHLSSGTSPGVLPTTADLFYNLTAVTYNGNPQPLNVTAKNSVSGLGAITVKYNNSTTAPINAGIYTVTAVIAEGSGYAAETLTLGTYIINKKISTDADLDYNLAAVTYNGNPCPVSVTAKSGVTGLGAITVKYDGNTVAPTNAGTYAVTVDIAAGTNYGAVTGLSLGNCTIGKKSPTVADLSYTLANIQHDGNPHPVTVTAKSGVNGLGAITVKYNNSSTAPKSIGTYAVTVDIAEGTNYAAATALALGSFEITADSQNDLYATLVFNMTDSYGNNGDTWGSSYIDILVDDVSIGHATFTLGLNGAEIILGDTYKNAVREFVVPAGAQVELIWKSTSWAYECGFTVSYKGGPQIFSKAQGTLTNTTTPLTTFTADAQYANYQRVTFHKNGDTNPEKTLHFGILPGDTIAASAYFNWTGHTITGWATSADGAAVYTVNSDVTITADIDLYATWDGVEPNSTPTATDLDYSLTAVTYNGNPRPVSVTAKPAVTGLGAIAVKYDGNTTAPTNAGTYAVTVDIAAGTNYAAITGLSLGNYTIGKATPTISDLSYTLANIQHDGNPHPVTVTAKGGIIGLGSITVKYNGNTAAPQNIGTYAVTVDTTAGTNYAATTALTLGSFEITAAPPAFVPVTSITGLPNTATAGTPLTLTGTVNPANATNHTIVWSVKTQGTTGATITGNTLNTMAAGTVTVTATIANGATASTDYKQDFNITVNPAAPTFTAVTNITGVPNTMTVKTPLILTGTVTPATATNKTIVWSVKSAGTTGATITGNTLNTTAVGTVTVTATIVNGASASTDYTQDFNITVTAPVFGSVPGTITGTNTNAVFTISGNFVDLDKIWINNNELTIDRTNPAKLLFSGYPDYAAILGDAVSGSVVITLYKEFLNTLPNGTYTLKVSFKEGAAPSPYATPQTDFIINRTSTPDGDGGNGGTGGDNSQSDSYVVIVDDGTPLAGIPTDNPNQPTLAKVELNANIDASGRATLTITDAQIKTLLEKVRDEAKKSGKTADGVGAVVIVKFGDKTLQSITVTVEDKAVDRMEREEVKIFSINTQLISFTLDTAAVKELNAQSTGHVSFSAIPVTKLSEAAAKIIGNRPVFDVTVGYQKDGKTAYVTDFKSGTVTLGIVYAPAPGEKTGNLYGVYVPANGQPQLLMQSSYDSGSVIFSRNTLSTYGVGYRLPAPAFTDTAGHWAKDDIDFVASRGLMTGTSDTEFSPNTAITRGMFVTILGRLSGADVSGYTQGSFNDVKTDAYYMPYIEWAVKSKIVTGIGNNQFAPDRAISREEMALIMANYAKAASYTLPVTREVYKFNDADNISSWATDAVKAIQQAGIISGKPGGIFDPKAGATRAEASAMIRRFVEIVIDSTTARGWSRNEAGQWMYWTWDGKLAVGWINTTTGAMYYMDENGIMVSGKWLLINDNWYYFYEDGKLATNTTIDGYEVGADGARKEN